MINQQTQQVYVFAENEIGKCRECLEIKKIYCYRASTGQEYCRKCCRGRKLTAVSQLDWQVYNTLKLQPTALPIRVASARLNKSREAIIESVNRLKFLGFQLDVDIRPETNNKTVLQIALEDVFRDNPDKLYTYLTLEEMFPKISSTKLRTTVRKMKTEGFIFSVNEHILYFQLAPKTKEQEIAIPCSLAS